MFGARRAGPLKGDSSSTVHPILNLESTMIKHALFVRLEAKPGKEKELAQFLQAGLGMARQEGTTPVWFALQQRRAVPPRGTSSRHRCYWTAGSYRDWFP